MLEPSVVESIRKLLDDGKSRRQVARITGVSRGRIIRIARNRYPDYDAMRAERRQQQSLPSRIVERCPTCRTLVRMPCLACRIRKLLIFGAKRPYAIGPPHGAQEPLGIQLKGSHRQRYEEIRAKRPWPRRGGSGPETGR